MIDVEILEPGIFILNEDLKTVESPAAEPSFDVLDTGEEQLKMPIEPVELVENPLVNYPDTDPCLCGSGHIWRRCHKFSLIKMVPEDEAEKITRFLDRYNKMLEAKLQENK